MTECTDMATIVEGYLGFRRKLGFNTNNEGKKLFNFIRYADRIGHQGPITSELVVRWSKYPQETNPGRHAQRLAVIRRFAKYWALFDPGVEVPPDGLLGPCSYRRRSPHIYSKEEISQLLKAAAKLSPYYGLRPSTYVTLFGLLACTGLRISEALQLTHKDVDLRVGILTVVDTKFKKSRLVPIHPSTVMALSFYAKHRDSYHPATQSIQFFLDEQGSLLKQSSVLKTFERLRHRLGWTSNSGYAPRIHDLRHTFAVRRLLAWYKGGADLDRNIAALSTYLGHVKVKDTYWYFTAVPELLTLAGSRFEHFAYEEVGGES